PFIIGEPNDKWDLKSQLDTCVHEHVHVDQLIRHGFARYAYRYLFSTAKRSMYEAEAYRSNMEMYFWRYGRLPSVKKLAAKLKNYGCRSVDIKAVEKYLAASAMAVKQGAIINRASQIGIRWLERNSPGL
ncbi:MAG: hypothetical protein GY854_22830, partial [Deltaproteobacteria bacterium]|nr:hypothetical protein [Deltaproteobacteria bacterium]